MWRATFSVRIMSLRQVKIGSDMPVDADNVKVKYTLENYRDHLLKDYRISGAHLEWIGLG